MNNIWLTLFVDILYNPVIMQIDIVIPSVGNTSNLNRLLASIAGQSHWVNQVIIITNRISESDFNQIVLETYNLSVNHIWIGHDYPHLLDSGPSAGRMIGILSSSSEYVYHIDDDNQLDHDFLAHTEYLIHKFSRLHDHFFICPIVLYRQTWLIQSVWFDHYSYRQSRPIPIAWINTYTPKQIQPAWAEARFPQMIWGNAICGRKTDFLRVWWDMNIIVTMEDIDWSKRASQMWYKLIVPIDLSIIHHERNKTLLQKKFIANPTLIFHKTLNRLIFVHKYANIWEKILFRCFGFWVITSYTLILIGLYLAKTKRFSALSALYRAHKQFIITYITK